MKRISTFLIQTFAILWLSAQMSAADDSIARKSMDAIFVEANQQFDQANVSAMSSPTEAQELYQKAALNYQYIADNSPDPSATLYINLGNAHFFSGEHGYAALNYQRALLLDNTQADALHNLKYLRSITVDELTVGSSQRVVDSLSFWHRWTANRRIILLAISNIVFWSLLALLFYKKDKWYWIGLTTSGVIALIFSCSLWVSNQGWDQKTDAVVIVREVVARQGNGYIYENAFTSPLHSGTEFTILETRGDWYHARLLNGKSCWLPAQSCILVQL